MVVVDGQGIPLGNYLESASPSEVTLIAPTLERVGVPRPGRGRPRKNPQRLIYDKAADSDPLRARLAPRGIELICPHRKNRKKPPTQDGRPLRRYKRRWTVERTFSWWGNFRRLVVRWEYHIEMYQAFVNVACLWIVLGTVMKLLLRYKPIPKRASTINWLVSNGKYGGFNAARIQLVSAISVCVERNPVSLHKISWGV